MSLFPAQRLIKNHGVETLARWAGRHRARVLAWTWSRAKGGTGGWVPLAAREAIRHAAAADGVLLEARDFEPWPGEPHESLVGNPADPTVAA